MRGLHSDALGAGDLENVVESGEVVLFVDGNAGAEECGDFGVLLLRVFLVKGGDEEKIALGSGADEEQRAGKREALLNGEVRAEENEVVANVREHAVISQGPDEGTEVVGDGPVLDAEDAAVGAGDEDAANIAGVAAGDLLLFGARDERVPGEGEQKLILSEEVDAGAVVEAEDFMFWAALVAEADKRQSPEGVGRGDVRRGCQLRAPGGGTDVGDLVGRRRRRRSGRFGDGFRTGRGGRVRRGRLHLDGEIGEGELGLGVEGEFVWRGERGDGVSLAREDRGRYRDSRELRRSSGVSRGRSPGGVRSSCWG